MPDEDFTHFTLSDVKAVADWRPPGQPTERLARQPITFSIGKNVLRKTVTFRARVSVSLKNSRPKVSLYLIITPNHIIFVKQASFSEHTTSTLRAEVAGLWFQLSKPGGAVVPSHLELVPKNKDSGDALEMIESMASAADMAFYLPRAAISHMR